MTILSDATTSHRSLGAGRSKILVTGGKGNFCATVVRELAGCGEVILTDLSPEVGDEPVAYDQADSIFGENLARIYHRDFGMEILSLRIERPFPNVPWLDALWRDDRRARSGYVTRDDIGRAVAGAVRSTEASGVLNVVSGSDNPRYNLENSRRMGYVPSARFTEEGLFVRTSEEAPWVMESATVRESISENI